MGSLSLNALTSKLRLFIISATPDASLMLRRTYMRIVTSFLFKPKLQKIFLQLNNFVAINRIYLFTARFKVVCSAGHNIYECNFLKHVNFSKIFLMLC